MQLGSGRAVIPLSTAGLGQSHAGEPGKFNIYCSRGHNRLVYYLFIFYVKFSDIWGIFV